MSDSLASSMVDHISEALRKQREERERIERKRRQIERAEEQLRE